MNIRKLFFIILLLTVLPLSVEIFAQRASQTETFVGTLNVGHSHFADGTTEDTFYLFDYQNFARPTIILQLDKDDLESLEVLADSDGSLVGVTGTVLPDQAFGTTIVLDVQKVHTQEGNLKYTPTIGLDQKVYTWTDKMYLSIIAPDFNKSANIIETIGGGNQGTVVISTSNHVLKNYELKETGADTGIFTGEVTLTGFLHDANGDGSFDTNPETFGKGNQDGHLQALNEDSVIVYFEEADMLVANSASVSWNLGEVSWFSLPESHPLFTKGFGIRVVDPDMNLSPEKADSFSININSDADPKGIDIILYETNYATGIFEGSVRMHINEESSGDIITVKGGGNVYAEYNDHTLPMPYSIKENELIVAKMSIPEKDEVSFDDSNANQADVFFTSHHKNIPDEPAIPSSINSVTILGKFNDVTEIPHPASYFEEKFYGATDSLARYWEENSFGKFTMNGEVIDWIDLPADASFYVNANGQLDAVMLINHAIQQVDPFIDFNGADDIIQNSNSQNLWQSGQTGDDIDQIIFVTNTKHFSAFSVFPRLQAFAFLHPHSVLTNEGQIYMWQSFYVDGGESFPIGSNIQKGYGSVAHELGHNFGWYHTPMLRPLDTYSDPWSIMSGWNDDSAPAGPIAYHKNKANWLNPNDVLEVPLGQSMIVELKYLNLESPDPNSYHMVKIPFGSGEFYTVEARQDVFFDHIPEPSGLVVYHYNPNGYGNKILRQTVALDVLAPVSINYDEDSICKQRHANGQCINWDFKLLDIDLGQTQTDTAHNISITLIEERQDSLVVSISNNAVQSISSNISILNETPNADNTITIPSQSNGDIHIEFTDSAGNIVSGVTYDIRVIHDNQVIFEETNLNAINGIVDHNVPTLIDLASDAKPVHIIVTQSGSNVTVKVVPEFSSMLYLVLAISIITIIAITRYKDSFHIG